MAEIKIFNNPRPKKSVLPPLPKKRKTEHKIEEINFDFEKRADYLTGFHKRKVARVKQAQAEAEKKAREERAELRKTLREERRKELEQHVDAVNALVGKKHTSDQDEKTSEEAWSGIEDDREREVVDHEEEYVDEDRYTTVTVEAVEVSKDGLLRISDDVDSETTEDVEAKPAKKELHGKKTWPKKEKKKKFRYESKAERKITRSKQKAGHKAKADTRRGKL